MYINLSVIYNLLARKKSESSVEKKDQTYNYRMNGVMIYISRCVTTATRLGVLTELKALFISKKGGREK